MILRNGSMNEFYTYIQDKEIICFGAAQMLIDMCCLYDEYQIEKYIKVLVDNNKEKQDTTMNVCGREIDIISVEDLCDKISKYTIIVITAGFFYEIVEQLQKIKELDKVECFIYPIMHYTKRNIKEIDKLKGKEIIPKVIHYCWFGKKEIPEFELSCINSWKEKCPDYEIKLWNEENYDINKIPYIKEAYKTGNYAFVSDYARLDIIYENGGVYLDTDVELIKPLDSLLKYKGFAAFQHNPRVATGLGIGGIKGLDIIGEMKEYYHNVHFINEDGSLNRKPCTLYQREVLLKHGLIENGQAQMLSNLMIFPQDYFQPRCPITGIIDVKKCTYAIHHSRESWASTLNLHKRKNTILSVENLLEQMIDL